MSKRLRLVVGVALLSALVLPVMAAGQNFFGRFSRIQPTAVKYDSQFAFTRIRYGSTTTRRPIGTSRPSSTTSPTCACI
jgi:hypothetical protein